MRFFIGPLTLFITGALIAQVTKSGDTATTKEIMTGIVIPSSNALFGVPEKPTDQEWAELRKQALILADAGNLLAMPGKMAGNGRQTANPADWNQAAASMREAAQLALKAIDKKDAEALTLDVAESILNSCSSCHDKYMK